MINIGYADDDCDCDCEPDLSLDVLDATCELKDCVSDIQGDLMLIKNKLKDLGYISCCGSVY